MKLRIKYIAIITIIFYIMMLFPGILIYAGPEDEGYKDGYTNGWVDGIEAAEIDYQNGDKKSYSKAMPNSTEITDDYNLKGESSKYRADFISGYRVGFREGYNMAYDSPNGEKKVSTNYAEALGFAMGEVNGYIDYYAGKANKWTSKVPTTSKIIEIFSLTKEPNNYKNNFISAFKIKYKEGYEYGYRKAKFDPYTTAINAGEADGVKFGGILGSNYGRIDYYNGDMSNWKNDLPSDSDIKAIFMLNNDSDDYSKAFLAGFKNAYRDKYEEAYRTANVNYNTLLFEKGYVQGKDIGLIKGESLAKIDFLAGKSNNENRHNFSDKVIINEYKLFNEDDKYKDGFISGFREGIKTGYIAIYQNSNFEDFMSKVETQIVPISGAQVVSGDGMMQLNIEKGIFYNDIVVSIDKLIGTNIAVKLPSKGRYTKASELYTIKVVNTSDYIDRDKSIKLSFEYYGPQNGGIYRYTNSGWIYLPSRINENSINTPLNPKSMNNKSGIYAVFIDDLASNSNDIRGHWAKDEIITYIRRGIAGIYNDGTFRPDLSLTKGQLLSYLSRAYKWNLNVSKKDLEELAEINDYESFDVYKELIVYSLKAGYLELSADNKVNIYNPVTYNEIESIMKKVTKDKNFNWKFIAEKIIKNKDKRVKSFDSMNNNITRAEFVYMLYYIAE